MPGQIAKEITRVLQRTEEARIYHYVHATHEFPPRRGENVPVDSS